MTNRLIEETSPYLLQHAKNPVDWFAWGEEALAKAKTENLPILLSIGYSSCHWCHVMAEESFEDVPTAQVMNEHFINIKVDREERPDLDKIYQQAFQLLNHQGGGWPLTMFLDPETLLPFFGGTYFPKNARYQLPGFVDLLMRISETFETKKIELGEQSEKLARAFEEMKMPAMEPQLDNVKVLEQTRDSLERQYDPESGGFSTAPKFPTSTKIAKLLKHWAYKRKSGSSDKNSLDMVMTTLTQIARGGIYDHLGGGFCRYSTDKQWMVPHFEKMLYDNGQLLSLYAFAIRLGPDQLFKDAIVETIDWLKREMRDPAGGFYSSLDADSEGKEGGFYAWRREELKGLLSKDQYLLIETLYGSDKPANFENKWVLYRNDSWRSVVSRLQLDPESAREELANAKQILFEHRQERVRPGRDQKILTSWNAITVKGILDCAASDADNPDWIDLATDALDFIREHLWNGDTLFATWQDSHAKISGYLDDYANLLNALLAILKTRWREEDIGLAIQIADALLNKFYDQEEGGFFFTAHDQESLFHRPKPTMDNELPSGNGIAALALFELGQLVGSSQYVDASAATLSWCRAALERFPSEHATLVEALEEQVYPSDLIILRGPGEEIRSWKNSLTAQYSPWQKIYCIPYECRNHTPSYLPALISAEKQEAPIAYVCQDLTCSLPITSLEELKKLIS